ncbi:MAG: segregation/condensation protein A [Candidatus Micrarchaeota archaeon]|nr:segregation/condensation protein A [Candidatus Micrarchaeota archaeon]
MATAAALESEATIDPQNMNLEKLVSEPTWKEILLDLAHKEKFDPWNIDIVQVVDRYIDAIKGMKVMDLRIPANIILAAAILLRLKSEMLSLQEQEALEEDATVEERPSVVVDPLSIRLRLPPRRRITLPELITALEEAMKLKEVRESIAKNDPAPIPININPIDIEAEIDRVYEKVVANADKSKMTTFSALSGGLGLEQALLEVFIPLLFLAHKRRITLIQERFFDDIIIALN